MSKAQTSMISSIIVLLILLLLLSQFFPKKSIKNEYQSELLQITFNELIKTKINNITLLEKIIIYTCEYNCINNCEQISQTLIKEDITKYLEKYFTTENYLFKINNKEYYNQTLLKPNSIIELKKNFNKYQKIKTYCNTDINISLSII